MNNVIARNKKMSLLVNKIVQLFILGGLMCFISGEKSSFKIVEKHGAQQASVSSDIKGYRDIISYNGKFLAVGTDGRIDYIDNSGERTPASNTCKNNLNCVVIKDQIIVVAGDNGTILLSIDGRLFTKVESGTEKNINGIAFKNEILIAGADKGTLLISKDGKSWNVIHLEVKGNIVSVTANDSFFFGITDSGEIFRSDDGLNWEIKDYNKEYSGYNKSCTFKKVLATKNRIVIMGRHDDGSPAVLFSSLGNVWTERSLNYKDDHGIIRFLTNEPNDITYDSVRDQFILACDNGEVFSLPSCTKCNVSVMASTNDLYAIICTNNLLLSAGEDFSINIIKF
jgi:hypothetical protein